MIKEEKLKKILKERLSLERYQHSLNTAKMAKELAKLYGCDSNKAYMAALAHDNAKDMKEEEVKDFVLKHHLPHHLLNKEYRKLVHADIGAIIAKEEFEFSDDMVDAIKYHTLAKKDMSLLEKIVYIADKIEVGRTYDVAIETRKLAFISLDKAIIYSLEQTRKRVLEQGKEFNLQSLEALDYLKKENNI